MARRTYDRRRKARRREQRGFSLFEVLIGASLLAIALLGHTASIFSEQRLSSEERARSTAMIAMEQFVERMRSDDDFAGLFARLNNFQELSRRSPQAAQTYMQELVEGYGDLGAMYDEEGQVEEGTQQTLYSTWLYEQANLEIVDDYDATISGYVTLRDGRRAFPAQTFYEDFVVPTGLRTLHVSVEVPSAPLTGQPEGGAVLREDLPLVRFGLPADLNGDGVIDDASHTDDYRAIPIVATFHWTTASGSSQEMPLTTWIWGYR